MAGGSALPHSAKYIDVACVYRNPVSKNEVGDLERIVQKSTHGWYLCGRTRQKRRVGEKSWGPIGRLQNSHVAQSKPRGQRSFIAQPSAVAQPPTITTTCVTSALEMDIRGWSSRLKKKFKPGSKQRKPDGPGVESGGERTDSASSLVRPPPHAVTSSGNNQGDDGINSDGQQVYSVGGLPPPDVERVPIRGGYNNHEGEGGGIGGEEVSQRHSRDVATGGGPSQEGDGANDERVGQVCPSPSTQIPHSGKPDGSMCTWLFWLSILIILRTLQTPLPPLIMCQKFLIPMRALNQGLVQMNVN